MAGSKEQEPQAPGVEVDIAEMEQDLGPPSGLTCPDCGGALWEVANGKMVRYKCHVGHQFSPDALVTEHSAAVESALWSAVRILEEHAELRLRLSRRAEAAGMRAVSHGFAERARKSQEQAHHIRTVLFGTEAEVAPAGAEGVEASAEERVESRKRSPRGRAATAARGKTRRRARGSGR
jgi:two-component system chemotaxis response regulator CheB